MQSEADTGSTIIVSHLDDMLIVAPGEKNLHRIRSQIEAHVQLRIEDSVNKFLEMCVDRNMESVSLWL